MAFFVININAAQIEALRQDLEPAKVKEIFSFYEEKLADATMEHIKEEASQKVKPDLLPKYIEGLQKTKITDGYSITNSKETEWIEVGIKPGFNMLPGILKGKNFVVVPFKHNKANKTPMQSKLMSKIRKELKARNISETKIERDESGRPKAGKDPVLLHKFSINEPVSKTNAYGLVPKTKRRPWMDHITDNHEAPMLWNVRVYQKLVPSKKGGSNMKVQKDIMTFRTASIKDMGRKWIHPGMPGAKVFDDVQSWIDEKWEQDLFPKILEDLGF